MSIQEIYLNFKRTFAERDTIIALILIAVGSTSFVLGRASVSSVGSIESATFSEVEKQKRVTPQQVPEIEKVDMPSAAAVAPAAAAAGDGGYVASKNGTKYHLPWCGSAKQIKEENKIWFTTKAEAEAAGYSPASNCKGI